MMDTLEQNGVKIVHHFGGNAYAKETLIPAGVMLMQHVHPHDHLSVLASGSVLLEVNGETREIAGPACMTIEAGKRHSVTAITDVVWFCIHGTTDTDPETVDTSILTGQ